MSITTRSVRACCFNGRRYWVFESGMDVSPSSLPTCFDLTPLALYSGRGAGGEGFALYFNWFFDREFNVYLRFRSVNK
jgi:hypothetical protein